MEKSFKKLLRLLLFELENACHLRIYCETCIGNEYVDIKIIEIELHNISEPLSYMKIRIKN